MKKYELTSQFIEHKGLVLYRIRALKDFSYVKAGEFGGWIESEENLSQYGTSWVFNNAKVYGNARVEDNAEIHNSAQIYDNAKVYGKAMVFNNAIICDNAAVYDKAYIGNDARIYNNAKVYENAKVLNNAHIYKDAAVYGHTKVFNYATISNKAKVYGIINVYNNAQIYGEATVRGYANIYGHAVIHGSTEIDASSISICGNADIGGDAKVYSKADYIVFKNFWSSERWFTWTRSNNMWKVGCFYGTGKELIKKAYHDSERSGKEYERVVRYVESILADE